MPEEVHKREENMREGRKVFNQDLRILLSWNEGKL